MSACWHARLLQLDSEKKPWRDSGSVPAEPLGYALAPQRTITSILAPDHAPRNG